MIETIWLKLFSPSKAFDHPVTLWLMVALGAVLLLTPLVVELLRKTGRIDEGLRKELHRRLLSWLVLVPAMALPLLLGPGCTILAITILSLLCYREFARATGFFRNRAISATVVVAMLALTFATYDHWYNFFVAIPSLAIALIVIVALFKDEPQGYLQRTSLGVLSFLLFGLCFGHLAYMANDHDYRPIMLILILCVEMNDVFAYITGKTFGSRKLAPNTSPGKTMGGAIGGLILTTALFALLGHWVFLGEALDSPVHLIAMGIIISLGGMCGDLVISSIKRDLGIKDMGTLLPGHGGLLDRFDSLMLVSPAIFHYVGYFQGWGLDQPERILTG
ncbi:MAG: phosphatidate cytidylyltransferase [Planctomycetota bacterium]|nr:phosphatidate cytidylyltransferase [Planctomycetota bacterium]